MSLNADFGVNLLARARANFVFSNEREVSRASEGVGSSRTESEGLGPTPVRQSRTKSDGVAGTWSDSVRLESDESRTESDQVRRGRRDSVRLHPTRSDSIRLRTDSVRLRPTPD